MTRKLTLAEFLYVCTFAVTDFLVVGANNFLRRREAWATAVNSTCAAHCSRVAGSVRAELAGGCNWNNSKTDFEDLYRKGSSSDAAVKVGNLSNPSSAMDSARTIDISNSPPKQPAPLPQKGLHSRFPPINLPTGATDQTPSTPPYASSGYESPPRTPKGHPMPMNNNDYLSRSSLIGFLGGGGNGNPVTPVGGARRQSAGGAKFYPPEQTSQRSSFTSTVSYLTRGIPRRVRTPLLMLLALTLLATVGLKFAHERADTLERMQAEKFAANLAKAYVVDSASAAAHGDKSAGAAKAVVDGLQPETYRKNDVKERQAPVVVPFDSSEVQFDMSAREETAALIAVSTNGLFEAQIGGGEVIGRKEVCRPIRAERG